MDRTKSFEPLRVINETTGQVVTLSDAVTELVANPDLIRIRDPKDSLHVSPFHTHARSRSSAGCNPFGVSISSIRKSANDRSNARFGRATTTSSMISPQRFHWDDKS
jgi:hypothetical protein